MRYIFSRGAMRRPRRETSVQIRLMADEKADFEEAARLFWALAVGLDSSIDAQRRSRGTCQGLGAEAVLQRRRLGRSLAPVPKERTEQKPASRVFPTYPASRHVLF